jgi:S-adenosylmethionine synthetase
MKTGQGYRDALTWSGICEISNEAKSLSALLPDTGRSSETQLAHVDAVRPIFRVRGLIASIRETSHQAPAGGNPFPSLAD